MIFKPHPYQQYAIDRIVHDKAVGLMLDMGLGKTSIVLSAVRELMLDRLEVGKVLVIAPKKVAEATWQAEARKWEEFRELRISTVLGTAKQRLDALSADADIYIINRENVTWLCELYGPKASAVWPFDMVVLDESTSFKSPSSKRFKSLRRMLPKINRMVLLTGTPAPNGVEDLWSQIYLLDRGERLYSAVTAFRERWFDHNMWTHEYKAKKGAFEDVKNRIADICVSMSAEDYLQLPERIVHDVPVELNEAARKAYRQMERDMVLAVAEDTEITAVTAAALSNKLLQLCSGAVYDEDHTAHIIHTGKLEMLSELLEGLHGEPALLFYGFQHEMEPIMEVIRKAGLRGRMLQTAQDADDWNAGDKIDVLMAHPSSCAYGLNLQRGGHHIIWYTLTWSLELYQQANARLHRQGQDKPVIIHRLIVRDGADEAVAAGLEAKEDMQLVLMKALKAKIR